MEQLTPSIKDRLSPAKWDTPEKAVGGAVLIGGIVAAVYFWGKIVPFLLALVTNTLYFAITAAILFLFLVIVLNPRFRTAVSYGLQMLLRAFAGLIVNTDKIQVMYIRLDKAKKDLAKYDEQIALLQGQKEKQDALLEKTTKEFNNARDREVVAEREMAKTSDETEKMQWQNAAQLATIELGAKDDLMKTYKDGSDQLAKSLIFFKRLRSAMDFAISKSKIELDGVKAKYDNIKAMHSIMGSAMRIVRGNPDDNYMFELAMQKTQDEMSQKLGEVKLASEYAKDFITNYDLDKGVLLERGKKLLEQAQGLSILNDDPSKLNTNNAQSSYSTGPNVSVTGNTGTRSLLD